MADHPTALEIHCKAGEDFSAKIEWVTEDGDAALFGGVKSNKPDTTGMYAHMAVRDDKYNIVLTLANEKIPDGTPPLKKGYIALLPDGTIHLFIPWEVTATTAAGTYQFDLFADVDLPDPSSFKPAGSRQRRAICSGLFIVHPYITSPYPGDSDDDKADSLA